MKKFVSILVFCSIIVYSASSTAQSVKSKKLSKAEFGKQWPLTVDQGIVKCVDGIYVIFQANNGKNYAVNGTALSKKTMKERGWIDVMDIWKSDPEIPGAKINITPVLDAGLALCK